MSSRVAPTSFEYIVEGVTLIGKLLAIVYSHSLSKGIGEGLLKRTLEGEKHATSAREDSVSVSEYKTYKG